MELLAMMTAGRKRKDFHQGCGPWDYIYLLKRLSKLLREGGLWSLEENSGGDYGEHLNKCMVV